MATTNEEIRTYSVTGMDCEHCIKAVTDAVDQLPGVTGVDIDLPTGKVTVTGENVDDQAVRDAVEKVGYEVAA